MYALCSVLKAIVAQCIADVSKSGNPISDGILTAIYRYLCGYGSGLLVDSALHKIIYGLMCKLFKKLVNGLRRLGTKIIHADFSRIIIDTNKKVCILSMHRLLYLFYYCTEYFLK